LGKAHSFTLLSQRAAEPPGDVAALLGLRDGAALIWLETLHLADGAPFVLEGRWLNPAALPPLPDFSAISANEWLVTQVSYTTGDIAFSASAASPHEAAVLQVPIGAPLFITERSTWTADAPITHVRLAHAPGYRLHTMV
jgi:GntR family histidine utilization transcriptional repressor